MKVKSKKEKVKSSSQKSKIIFLFFIFAFLLLPFDFSFAQHEGHETQTAQGIYYCPMHPDFTSDKPGSCPICGMNLVKKEIASENTATGGIETGIYMSQEKQQMIGVKKEKVEKRKLTRQILTVGKVAYDPELFIAQEEYLQALKVKEQAGSLADASKKKLLLLGMNEEAIKELAIKGKAQQNLYLPGGDDKIWVYLTIYEYEINLVKEGQIVEIDSVASPGELFKGVIISITPVLDPETRSIQARVEVDNPEHKLKPQMFVNAKIGVDLGEKLAVREDAILDTGMRKIVYVVKEGDILEQRDIKVGQAAGGFYEVLDGLNEGDVVVISGNFLVDSESRLKSAVQSSEHKPKGDGLASDSQSHKHGQ